MNKDLIRNIKIHNKIANEYDKLHVEIFNQKEQGRLHKELSICLEHIKKIRCKVAKIQKDAPAQTHKMTRSRQTLSPENAEMIRDMADCIADESLALALKKIVRHVR